MDVNRYDHTPQCCSVVVFVALNASCLCINIILRRTGGGGGLGGDRNLPEGIPYLNLPVHQHCSEEKGEKRWRANTIVY